MYRGIAAPRSRLADAEKSSWITEPNPLSSSVMTAAELFESITNGGTSDFGQVVAVLKEQDIKWCLIGGLAVNCYVTPVYTTDADFVVVTEMLDLVVQKLTDKGFKISRFEFSVNAQKPGSDLVIQFTRDERYQPFVERAEIREIFDHSVPVAALPDLIQGKIWAWEDSRRRLSKRTKDQADLIRIGESYPELLQLLPESLRQALRDQGNDRFGFGMRP